jgi:hypothetical protein
VSLLGWGQERAFCADGSRLAADGLVCDEVLSHGTQQQVEPAAVSAAHEFFCWPVLESPVTSLIVEQVMLQQLPQFQAHIAVRELLNS